MDKNSMSAVLLGPIACPYSHINADVYLHCIPPSHTKGSKSSSCTQLIDEGRLKYPSHPHKSWTAEGVLC